jgi:hypothetical protein
MRGLPRMASICGDLSGCPVLRIELSCFLCGCTSKRPLSVVKRTFGSAAAMSATDPKRTSSLLTRSPQAQAASDNEKQGAEVA